MFKFDKLTTILQFKQKTFVILSFLNSTIYIIPHYVRISSKNWSLCFYHDKRVIYTLTMTSEVIWFKLRILWSPVNKFQANRFINHFQQILINNLSHINVYYLWIKFFENENIKFPFNLIHCSWDYQIIKNFVYLLHVHQFIIL